MLDLTRLRGKAMVPRAEGVGGGTRPLSGSLWQAVNSQTN